MVDNIKEVSKSSYRLESAIQLFFKQVIEETKLTHAEIADKLDTGANKTLTETKISQYLNSHAALSKGRLLKYARQTVELGWKIPIAETMLIADDISQVAGIPYDENLKHSKIIDKSILRSEKAEFAALEKSIDSLINPKPKLVEQKKLDAPTIFEYIDDPKKSYDDINLASLEKLVAYEGLDAHVIVGLVIFLTQKLTPPHRWSGGGMVNPAWMNQVLGGDGSDYSGMRWLQWKFLTLDETEQYLQAQVNDKKDAVKFKPSLAAKSTTKKSAKPKAVKKSPAKLTHSSK